MATIEVRVEVTGLVWEVVARPGDRVAAGDPLMILESMKMEIPVVTEREGTIKEILVTEGMPVSEGQVVALMER